MREILFRGKSVFDGKWHEGDLRHFDHETLIIAPYGGEYCESCPETVGQYTGLTDRHGNRIFEGDIVRGRDALEKGLVVEGYIDHQYGSFCIVGDLMTHLRWMDYEVEVIGNIHDNPEMIGGKEDEVP